MHPSLPFPLTPYPLPYSSMSESFLEIERHRAAIPRADISRPVKLALEWKIISEDRCFSIMVAATVVI
jgi:hypothetical protein